MFSTAIFWAIMGYCGSPNIPYIPHIPGSPTPPPPDPFLVARLGIVLLGGIAGGYLGRIFLEPSLIVSGISAYATARVLSGISFVLLSPHPLPPKE